MPGTSISHPASDDRQDFFTSVTGRHPSGPPIAELAEHARHTYTLSAPQTRALNTTIDYLVNAARRLGRIDWLNVCAGTILGYVLTVSLPPDAARDLFIGFARAIGHLCGLPDLPMLLC